MKQIKIKIKIKIIIKIRQHLIAWHIHHWTKRNRMRERNLPVGFKIKNRDAHATLQWQLELPFFPFLQTEETNTKISKMLGWEQGMG
uniref:Uncharacterized protein n=1 Tax=Gossypium raimondii TaxID=29730 RepID=A0A0D2PZQ6_GOSRA|nr:hypothetical protein B456_005G259900 [Gossypium raimondii]